MRPTGEHKATNGFVYPTSGWDGDWIYHFRLGEYKNIEWCELTPREGVECIDCAQIVEACKRIGLEHQALGNVIRVIGYRRILARSLDVVGRHERSESRRMKDKTE